MMKKRYVIFLIVICFILCGCTSVNDMSLDKIINKSTERNIEVYNKYRKGYKYNLPMGLVVRKSTDYNETLFDGKYTYYLFVDAVSYYNKVIDTYEVSEESYVSMPISFEDKYGYLEINNVGSDKYFIEIMYNYAKIEVIVKKKDINLVVANSLVILNSVQFNNDILKSLLDEEISQFNEFEFNIFETSTKTESDFLQALDGDVYEEPEVHDSDLIN